MRIMTKIAKTIHRFIEMYLIDEYEIDTVSTKDSNKNNSKNS